MQITEKNNVFVISFAASPLPKFVEARGKDWIKYGEKDNWDVYLVELLDKSSKHNAIVLGKADYIFGKGIQAAQEDDKVIKFLKYANRYNQPLNSLLEPSILDVELFGGFYWQMIPKRGGGYERYYLEFKKVRKDKNAGFWYKKDGKWDDTKEKPIYFDEFKPGLGKASIFCYYERRPGQDKYPFPNYISSRVWIESDIEVSEQVHSNAKGGFSASKLINFYTGTPANEVQGRIEKNLENKFTGPKGKKFVLSFTDGTGKAPDVLDLGASDLTKENFSTVDKLIEQNIFSGHRVTSPMLFGIKTEGQLGGRAELRDAYEIFKNTYVNAKQQKLEQVINFHAGLEGITTDFTFIPTEPIGIALSEAVLEKILTVDELREMVGRKPKSQVAVAKMQSEEEVADMFSEFGDLKTDFEIIQSKKVKYTSDKQALEGELKFFSSQKFSVTQTEASILDLISKDKRITPDVIAETLNVNTKWVENKIKSLESKGLITISTVTENGADVIIKELNKPLREITDGTKPETSEILIRYSYEGPKDDRNRPFCAKMLELDRLYSRTEIEKISERLGYSVWDRRGGFWNKPDGTTSPYCRHSFFSHTVIKKK